MIEEVNKQLKEVETMKTQQDNELIQTKHQLTLTTQRLQDAEERIIESMATITQNKGVSYHIQYITNVIL